MKRSGKKTMQKRVNAFLTGILAIFVMGMSVPPVYAAKAQPQTVRVGYFAFEGYHNQDADGSRSGYGYDYLQQMARYTGWLYDYVGYEGSWNDAQQMLESGEIDLLTSAQKTQRREAVFDFSNEPIGYSSTLFTIKAGNTKYTIDNFETFNGVRVGMIDGNSRNDGFAKFAAEKEFTYRSVMFDDTTEMVAALQAEQIDAIVTSSLRAITEEWIVASFDVSPYYVCVRKGNQELLDQVNMAISSINKNDPGIQNELENKYYGTDGGESIAFTEEERNYIAAYRQSGGKLRVMINPDRAPMSFYENEEMSGIFGETVRKILERSGLPYEIVVPQDRTEYETFKKTHAADLCMDMRFDFTNAETLGYRLTDSYYNASISRVTRSNFQGEIQTIAAIQNADISENLKKRAYQNAAITYYGTTDECVRAVQNGEQDAAFVYAYVAEAYIAKDFRHQLNATLMPDFNTNFCIGIADIADTTLFSILNKCVGSIDRNWQDSVTMSYTKTGDGRITLMQLIYANPLLAIVSLAILILLLGAITLLLYRQRIQKRDAERAKEIQRLFSYVCKEHEKVMEINLRAMQAKEYTWRDHQLHVEERRYRTKDNFMQFMQPEDYADLTKGLTEEMLLDVIKKGGEYAFEARGNDGEGGYKWYIYTIYGIVPDATHPCNFMLFKHDINDMKQKDEDSRRALVDALRVAKEASMAKGTFMSRMSHEIRTPLNAVIGYMQIAKDSGKEPEKMMHCVENSEIAAKHLLSVINDVLDISSIESGKMKIAMEEFDLKEQITSVSTIFFNQAKSKGVKFEVVLRHVTEEAVIGDSLRLNQILMNLLSNAVKFTPEGGTITLTIEQTDLENQKINMRFSVSDTGIGMSEEYQKRLFQPFEQESAATAQKYGGSGLGLSITFNLIQMMGGSIDVRSRQGAGTTFVVSLTFARGAQRPEKPTLQDYSRLRVLIVDDDEDTCAYMKALFKRCKIKCDIVKSGEAAIQQIRRRMGSEYRYDLCIMDWNMPDMDGVETARRMKEECDAQMPIVIATAYDVTDFSEEAKAAGVSKIIAKPLFQSTMFDLLVSTFGKYEPIEDGTESFEEIKGLRVLLAEDNPMNMEIAVDILSKAGLIVDSVTNGRQAADRFIGSPAGTYDAILMDVQMPVMNGYEATGAIRASEHPEAQSIPIIAMTANAFSEDVNAALASGMNGHIAKPVEYGKLYAALNACRKRDK